MLDWFFRHKKQPAEIVVINEEIILVEGHHFHKHKHRYRLILTINNILNDSKLQIMSLSLVSNQQVAGTLSLLDNVTNNPVSATFANVIANSDNTAAFSATSDGTSSVNVIGIAAGTGNVTVTADCTYTDSTGAAQTKNLSFSTDVTVSAIITADAVSLVVTFGTPTAQ